MEMSKVAEIGDETLDQRYQVVSEVRARIPSEARTPFEACNKLLNIPEKNFWLSYRETLMEGIRRRASFQYETTRIHGGGRDKRWFTCGSHAGCPSTEGGLPSCCPCSRYTQPLVSSTCFQNTRPQKRNLVNLRDYLISTRSFGLNAPATRKGGIRIQPHFKLHAYCVCSFHMDLRKFFLITEQ